ncbi:alpha/beta fold hydrolase [Shinella sp.]|uniref:alpha/beta fold hydrolase n=1 Tax=Shinella sp. TaxID=1870904 RepID=UPI0029C006EC|nr:alpha/beta fold hydrolase [Shinella sp.]
MTYDVSGNGEALLLIPGLGGAASFWKDIIPLLADRYRTISFDHRGTARSDRPAGRYSIARIARDAVEILGAETIERAHVVGHSTGGMVAQYIALDAPEMVHSLVISGSWEKPDARFVAMFEARLAVLRVAGPREYQKLTHAIGFPSAFLQANAGLLQAAIENADKALSPREVAEARIEMLLTDERSTDLSRITAPTLVIGATDDALIPFSHSRKLADMIPGARLAVIDGAHFFPRVHPQQYATALRDFLEAVHEK